MKKWIALILALVLCLSLCACGGMAGGMAGKTVTFGSYEQDGNGGAAEPIEWIVLAEEGENVLLISKYCLDGQCYDLGGRKGESRFEKCSLNLWLNSVFASTAFSADTAGQIKVRILTADEVEAYFPKEEDRIAFPTKYAEKQGIPVDSKTGAAQWWTIEISSFNGDKLSTFVYYDGSMDSNATLGHELGVRPVISVPKSILPK